MRISLSIVLTVLYCGILFAQQRDYAVLLDKASSFRKAEQFDSSFVYAQRAAKIAQELAADSLYLNSLQEMMLASNMVFPVKTDSLYQLALISARKLKNPNKLIELLYHRGNIHYYNRAYATALPLLLQVDSLAKENNILNETVIKTYLVRSEISRKTFNYDGVEIARKMQLEAMEMAKSINSKPMIHDLHLKMADMNGMMGNIELAKKYNDSAYAYFKEVKAYDKLTDVYFTYMNCFYASDDFDAGGAILKEGIDYFKAEKQASKVAWMQVQYGNFFRKRKNDCASAIEQYEQAKAFYDQLENNVTKTHIYLLEGLGICYAAEENYKAAFQNYQQTYVMHKALVKKENNNLSRTLEARYRTAEKEQQIALLTAQNDLIALQKKNQRNLLLGILLLISLLSLFLFIQFKNRLRVTKKLKELDLAKSTFFANISHEFRTPLTLIRGPIEDRLARKDVDGAAKNSLSIAHRNTKRLEILVDQLLALSKLETGNLKLNVQPGNLSEFIAAQADAFSYSASEKNIKYTVDLENRESQSWFDRDALEKILFNLIGNAIKYTPENGRVIIAGTELNNEYHITVSNSDAYLSEDQKERIFERFYQTNDQNSGTGIGLALTKELVELHHGKISVDSEEDGETVFSVIIPIKRNSYNDSELLTEELQTKDLAQSMYDIPVQTEVLVSEEAPLLLIVDDNAEIRKYIASIFENTYQILQATNGNLGIELAIEKIPDIIISDLMMPETDGYSLTNTLKTHELTSHIPIVLLTAKADDRDKLEGLKKGADAYITKPFSSQLLVATVENLFESRQKLQERFSKEVLLKAKTVELPSTDQQFIERLQKVFDDHLVDPDFNVEKCASFMGLSRMQLHRKLKALSGQSTGKFINSQRLELAAKLLKDEGISVSEVGYSVGFNDPSYFAKCFKKEYGFSPSEFQSK